MMNNRWYNIEMADDSTSAEVSIYDAIGGFDITAKQFAEDLTKIEADTIHLRINSPGGSVIDGNAIFNALQRHDAKVITHIDGLAASMASVVAMVGDEVHMSDNALMMIHNPWTITMGDADELRADADLLDKMSASIISAYSRSQYEADEIKALMDNETWMTAQEALDAGFIDHIDGGLRAAASDITALAEGSELSVPADKQIASLGKQLEAVSKQSNDFSAQLEETTQQLNEVTEQLTEAKAEIEQKDQAFEEADQIIKEATDKIESHSILLEAKESEIVEARQITEDAISARAAELIQQNAVAPVAEIDEIKQLSSDEFWAEYKRIGDEHGLDAKNVYYAENKHRLI